MRGDRLLSILLQLQAGGRLTARELADRLEVSERTIHRDVDALSGAGVPVYAERGRGGGIGLLDDYRTDLTGLTSDEARALFSFGGPQVAGQLGLGSDLEAALRKLLAALPAAQRLGAQRARERLLVDTSPWLRSADALPRLAQLQDAVWGDRRLRIRYRQGEGGEGASSSSPRWARLAPSCSASAPRSRPWPQRSCGPSWPPWPAPCSSSTTVAKVTQDGYAGRTGLRAPVPTVPVADRARTGRAARWPQPRQPLPPAVPRLHQPRPGQPQVD